MLELHFPIVEHLAISDQTMCLRTFKGTTTKKYEWLAAFVIKESVRYLFQ